MRSQDPGRLVLAAIALGVAAWAVPVAAAAAAKSTMSLRGEVVDVLGSPMAGVTVFAVSEGTNKVTASGRTDRTGQFSLQVPPMKHRLGLSSVVLDILAYEERQPGQVRVLATARPMWVDEETLTAALEGPGIEVAPGTEPAPDPTKTVALPPPPPPVNTPGDDIPPADIPPDQTAAPGGPTITVGLTTGRITDVTGEPLGGVRVLAIDPKSKRLAAVAWTGDDGNYTLPLGRGTYRIRPVSAGLKLQKHNTRGADRIDFVMEIDARPQEVRTTDGHVLKFRVEDSIWPEYLPPPEVRAWLAYAYGYKDDLKCPSIAFVGPGGQPLQLLCPASVMVANTKPRKYWWLRMLQQPYKGGRVTAPEGIPDRAIQPSVSEQINR